MQFLFSFGRPIATSGYRRKTDDVAAMMALRAKVAASIEAQIAQLLDRRKGPAADRSAHPRSGR